MDGTYTFVDLQADVRRVNSPAERKYRNLNRANARGPHGNVTTTADTSTKLQSTTRPQGKRDWISGRVTNAVMPGTCYPDANAFELDSVRANQGAS